MRKTNLFYLEDNNSNFLTFSNYGEYLTGVCLSTNHKIWPSSFLCLNLPFGNQTNEINNININNNDYNEGVGNFENVKTNYQCTLENFKIFLMNYYENKLAKLRDQYDKLNKKQEDLHGENKKLLLYLLEAISLFFNIKLNEQNENDEDYIQYYGDIVEHDYNGSYNDSICIVDFNKEKPFNILYTSNNLNCYSISNRSLYNWTQNELPNIDIYHPISDNVNNSDYTYNNNNFIYINSNNQTIDNQKKEIKFNCVIPLFDIKDDDISEYNTIIDERNLSSDDPYSMIPYGIWFTSQNEDNKLNTITLYKNNDNISQSWSLVICSKFSPYPYGVKINDEFKTEDKLIEKYTYAELLSKNSELLEMYNNLSINYQALLTKVNTLSTEVNNLKQLYPETTGVSIVDQVEEKIRNNEIYIHNEVESLKQQFEEYMNQLRWKSINTSN